MQPTESTFGFILYTCVLIVSLVFFAYFMYKRLRILKFTQKEPVNRWDNIAKRIFAVLKFFIGQGRILDRRFLSAGLMHAFIFWGFLAVSFRWVTILMKQTQMNVPSGRYWLMRSL